MSFKLLNVLNDGYEYPLLDPSSVEPLDQNVFTVVIGKNGTGKSRMLADICRVFAYADGQALVGDSRSTTPPSRPSIPTVVSYLSHGESVSLTLHPRSRAKGRVAFELHAKEFTDTSKILPARVVATTTTPFDKFPLKRSATKSRLAEEFFGPAYPGIYAYMGAKSRGWATSSSEHLHKVLSQLAISSQLGSLDAPRLESVFRMLGYEPTMRVEYRLSFARGLLDELASPNLDAKSLRDTIRHSPDYRHYTLALALQDQEQIRSLQEAARIVLASSNDGRRISAIFTLALGFGESDSGRFFHSLTILRRCGLLSFSDLVLLKADTLEEVPFKFASSGQQGLTLLFLGIAASIKDSSLVLIDEPELALHPEWQERVVPLLADTFSLYSGCHFVLATHSPQILAQAGRYNCFVLDMEDRQLQRASNFAKRSADYQLAEAFDAPGPRNEYLTRTVLAAIASAKLENLQSPKFIGYWDTLMHSRPNLDDDDPVAVLIDSLIDAVRQLRVQL